MSQSTAARILRSLKFKKPNTESYRSFQEERKSRQAVIKPAPDNCKNWMLMRKPHQAKAQLLITHPHSAFAPPKPRAPEIKNKEVSLQKRTRSGVKY